MRLVNMLLCCKGLKTAPGGSYDKAVRVPAVPGKGAFTDYLIQVLGVGSVASSVACSSTQCHTT